MKGTQNHFLAFSFGDYEGVRIWLDDLATRGWELAGRSGWLTGRFERTNRSELRYDVVPVLPRKPEEMQREVERRREAGWEPVETIWGMDIYKSMPCQEPELFRTQEHLRAVRSVFRRRLAQSIAFLAVTLAALVTVCFLSRMEGASRSGGIRMEDLTHGWYLSDSRTALYLLLPLLGVLALLWLGWLVFCLLFRRGTHRPRGRGMLFVRGILQLVAIGAAGLLLVVLWVDAIPRLWLRVALVLCFAAVPLAAHLIGREDTRRRLLTTGAGIFACFLAAMVLSWTVSPVSYDVLTDGSGWRTRLENAPILRAEDLGLDVEDETVSAWYEQGGSVLVQKRQYSERWSNGVSIEVTEYTCLIPSMTDVIFHDRVGYPSGVPDWGLPHLGYQNGWYQLWYEDGRRLICVAGTADWSDEALQERAMELLRR